ncbi:MAG: hypothetical protein JWP12_2410 [Bacteroidetes bacterium]|nr:hypothetical protein [Bacteroidota bacterium]
MPTITVGIPRVKHTKKEIIPSVIHSNYNATFCLNSVLPVQGKNMVPFFVMVIHIDRINAANGFHDR